MSWEIRQGRSLDLLAEMPDESVQTCVTSPPYWGLRDYGEDDQLGLEPTPEEYVANMVEVFREVRRVLRDDGTLWLNLGDSYASGEIGRHDGRTEGSQYGAKHPGKRQQARLTTGLKPKDLVGIPWRVALALQADGWYLRSDIIWHKPNPMPESVTDRPTKSHEYIFLLTKQPRYYYDANAISEELAHPAHAPLNKSAPVSGMGGANNIGDSSKVWGQNGRRNKRSVWTVTTKPFSGAHFAVFPPDLIEPCVLAGASPTACGECGAPYERIVERTSSGRVEKFGASAETTLRNDAAAHEGRVGEVRTQTVGWQPSCDHSDDSGKSVVLDPFSGSGTTGMVALRHGRSYIGLELNPEYAEMSRNRIRDDAPLLNTGLEVAA